MTRQANNFFRFSCIRSSMPYCPHGCMGPEKTTMMRAVRGSLKSTGTTLSLESAARVAISK